MLTIEAIREQIAAMRIPVTRETWKEIANTIHPNNPRRVRPLVMDDLDLLDDIWWTHPAYLEERRPNPRPDNWEDVVIATVLSRQWTVITNEWIQELNAERQPITA